MTQAGFDLELKPSTRAHQVLFWIHLVPLVLAPFAVSSSAGLLLLAAGFGLSWLYLRRHRAFGHGRGAILKIRAEVDGGWKVSGGEGGYLDAELLGSSVIAGQFMVLNFRLPKGSHRSRVLLGDETSPEGLRRLRARLKSESS